MNLNLVFKSIKDSYPEYNREIVVIKTRDTFGTLGVNFETTTVEYLWNYYDLDDKPIGWSQEYCPKIDKGFSLGDTQTFNDCYIKLDLNLEEDVIYWLYLEDFQNILKQGYLPNAK